LGLDTTEVNLIWQNYEGFYFPYYIIFRGTSTDNLEPIDTIPVEDNTLTYTDYPVIGRHYYRIGIPLQSLCVPTGNLKADSGPYSHSMSNIEDNRLESQDSLVVPSGLYAHQCNKKIYLLLKGYSSRKLYKFNIYRSLNSPSTVLFDSLKAHEYNDTILVDPVEYGDAWYYRITAVDSAGNETNYSNEVMVSVKKALDLGPDLSLCENDMIRLDAGEGFINYQWSVPDSAGQYLTVKNPGTYWVTVTDDNGCTNYDTVKVIVYASAYVNLGPDRWICPGESIILSAKEEYLTYLWNTGATCDTLVVTEPGVYSLTVTSGGDCEGYDEVHITQLETYQNSEICMITVNNDNRIIVIWEKTYGKGIAFYNIYREQTKNNYTKLASVPFDSLSIYIDKASVPNENPHIYKISVTDSCGNESQLSPHHKSVHLQTNAGIANEVNLTWSEYEGFDFNQYEIYRGPSLDNLTSIRTITSNVRSWTDDNPPVGNNYYRIMAVKPESCFPTKYKAYEYTSPFSNYDKETISGIENVFINDLIIYPNPVTDKTTIKIPNSEHAFYHLILTDLTGKVIFIKKNIIEETFELNLENISQGLYLIELRGKNIYRGKIIIE